MATLKELRDERIKKLNKLTELGFNPYPASSDKNFSIGELLENYKKNSGKSFAVAGRIMSIREHGKLMFFNLKDETGKVQLYIKEQNMPTRKPNDNEFSFEDLALLDPGDYIETTGKLTKTKSGEISIESTSIKILAKALRPIPTEHFGVKNIEERYRKRYLDMLTNERTKEILDIRWKITKEIRSFLWGEGFKEVETPVLQPLYGGTNAKPFTTHFNALDRDFYLRIAPELYLKRLIVGGYEKVFEIARNFRNEGIDQTHFPEFSMLEWYEAYADYHRVMDLAEALTKHLVKEIFKSDSITVNGEQIKIMHTWKRLSVDEVLKEHLQIDWEKTSEEQAKKLQQQYKIEIAGTWTKNKVLFSIFEKHVAPNLIEPTWVHDYPKEVSPLSKTHRTQPERAERFEAYIGGVEIYDGWSEVISGIEQRNRFEIEQKNMKQGDEEAMPLDEDFIEALEYGCPPLGGIGLGIERMVMFLTDTWAIKEVVAFPILRPASENKQKNSESDQSHKTAPVELPQEKCEFTRESAHQLLEKHVKDDYQKIHAKMVAVAMEAYAEKFGEDKDLWYITGLLHDLDYFEYPQQHPQVSLDWFSSWEFPQEMIHAVAAHGHKITGDEPKTQLAAALLAVDELAGFLYAYSLMRPEGFIGMSSKSAKKKFKDKAFARKVDREEIKYGIEKFGVTFGDHTQFLIDVFRI